MPTHHVEDEPKLLQEYRSHLSSEIINALTEDDCRRFLRARTWNVKKAVEMTEKWWTWYNTPLANGKTPATILDDFEDPNEPIYQELMPHTNFGEDRHGRPVYWEKTGLISSRFSKIKEKLSENDLVIRHIRQQELMVRRMNVMSEAKSEKIEKQVIVFDLANLSYSMDSVAMSTFRQTLHIDQHYYPERLQYLIMVNAPWFFTAIWSLVRPWIDPVTADKIRILGHDYIGHLKEPIDEKYIPKEMGGECEDFTWQWPYPESSGIHVTQLAAMKSAHQTQSNTVEQVATDESSNSAQEITSP